MKKISAAAGILVLLAALYLAFPGEHALAQLAGWSPRYSWAMPFVLTAYTLVSTFIAAIRRTCSSGLGALAALALAMAGQVIAHLIAAGYAHSGPILVAAVSAVPPLVVAHVGHMLFQIHRTGPHRAAEPSAVAAVTNEPPEPDSTPENGFPAAADDTWRQFDDAAKRPAPAEPVRPDLSAIRDAVRSLSADGRVTGQRIAEHFGVSERTGRRYLAMATA